MKRILFLMPVIFLFSCQTLPVITLTEEKPFVCPSPFLKEKSRLVHAIENRVRGNVQSSVLGVTLADPATRSFSCAIITAEGMSLFETDFSPEAVKIHRALPPFASEDFAKNMMEDIKLIFLAPEGQLQDKGYLSDGSKACRYLQTSGDWIDVIEHPSDGIQIKRYSSASVLKKHVTYSKQGKDIYQHIELNAHEFFDYSLLMNLIEAQPVKKQAQKSK